MSDLVTPLLYLNANIYIVENVHYLSLIGWSSTFGNRVHYKTKGNLKSKLASMSGAYKYIFEGQQAEHPEHPDSMVLPNACCPNLDNIYWFGSLSCVRSI